MGWNQQNSTLAYGLSLFFLLYIYTHTHKLEILYICNFPKILQPKLIFVEFFGMLYSHS